MNGSAWTDWAKVAVWCGLIYFFSSRPELTGKKLDLETLPGILDFLAHKAAHLIEYAVLMVLTVLALKRSWPRLERGWFLLAFLFCAFYAASDEWHQTFVTGRVGSVSDVLIDAVGAFAGGLYARART